MSMSEEKTTKMTDEGRLHAALSAREEPSPDRAAYLTQDEVPLVLSALRKAAHERSERLEREAQAVREGQYSATISAQTIHFLGPVLERQKEVDIRRYTGTVGVSVMASAEGGCVVTATDGKIIALVHDRQATLSLPEGVGEWRFTVPPAIVAACAPPEVPSLIAPGERPYPVWENFPLTAVPKSVFVFGAGMFVQSADSPHDEEEWPDGGVLANEIRRDGVLSSESYTWTTAPAGGERLIRDVLTPLSKTALAPENQIAKSAVGPEVTDATARAMQAWFEWDGFVARICHRLPEGDPWREATPRAFAWSVTHAQIPRAQALGGVADSLTCWSHESGRVLIMQACAHTSASQPVAAGEWLRPAMVAAPMPDVRAGDAAVGLS